MKFYEFAALHVHVVSFQLTDNHYLLIKSDIMVISSLQSIFMFRMLTSLQKDLQTSDSI